MGLLPWKVLSSKHIQPQFRVDRVELSNGHQFNAYILEPQSWANVLALTPDRRAVLVRQYRHGVQKVLLELPGGVIEEGEDPLDGIRRELREETGYTAGRIIEVGRIHPNPAIQTNTLFGYLALDVEKTGAQDLDAGEEIEVELEPLAELTGLAARSEFPHALHVAVLFQALAWLEKNP